jgi:Ankyrin repeat.
MTLHQAANDGRLPIEDTLVDLGCHVDAVDADGCGAMFYAVEYEHRDITEFLLKNGANVNIGNAVHYLAKTGKVNLLAFLVE